MKKLLEKLTYPFKKLHTLLSSKKWLHRLMWLTTPLFVAACFYMTEFANRGTAEGVLDFVCANVDKTVFALVILSLLSGVFILLFRYLWAYALAMGTLTMIMSIVNYLKFNARGDNFLPWDITMLGNADQLAGFTKFNVPISFFVIIGIFLLYCVFLAFTGTRVKLKWYASMPISLAIILPLVALYFLPLLAQRMFMWAGMNYNDTVAQSRNYSSNGFVNAYTLNVFSLAVTSPDDYDQQTVNDILDGYSGVEGTQTPDIVCVMSEAFCDIRTLKGTTFSVDPLANFDEIKSRDNACSGTLYTIALGGGTVCTEFEFLTGLAVDSLKNFTSPWPYLKKPTETYVSNYKSLGYTTTAIHTYTSEFYERNRAYPLLGFDSFIAEEEILENYDVTYRRNYLTDDVFMNVVIDTLEKNTDTPNFIYGITMENHGGYWAPTPEETVVEVNNKRLDKDYLEVLQGYTQGVYHADQSLKKLIDYVDSRTKPTVVVFFGDHKPVIGNYADAFRQAGNIDPKGGYNVSENKYIYSVPYLVYSNYKSEYGKLDTASEISPKNLLTLVAQATGTGMTPYMQYLATNFNILPYYNVQLGIPLDIEQITLVKNINTLTYDRIIGKRYSVK